MTTSRLIYVLLATGACATPMSSLRADNHRLEQQIEDLRADHRSQERKVRDLEHQLALARENGSTDSSVPKLPIEVIGPMGGSAPVAAAPALPDGGRVVGVADDGGDIIYEGDAATGKSASIDDEPAAPMPPPSRRGKASASSAPSATNLANEPLPVTTDRLEVTHRVPMAARPTRSHVRADRDASPTVAAATPAGDAGADYRAAVELVKAAKYPEAIAALRAFIEHYPRHDYADNAQYWLGEVYYAQQDYTHALTEFRATIETYPRGNKVPDALLKVGYCYQALGQTEKARAVLEQVVNLYPKSEPAVLATKRLEKP